MQKGVNAMAKTVIIDADECIGCESCVELCSEVFTFNEAEEKAEVILPTGGPEDCIEEAMDTCPVECIHWEED
jgi:ferredoxin